jgi:hypothetical protein
MDVLKLLNGTGGTLTVAGGMAIILGVMFRLLVLERRAHTDTSTRLQAELKERSERWTEDRKELLDQWRTEIARINQDHDREIDEMRAKIRGLQDAEIANSARFNSEVERLNKRVDSEIELRREAQRGGT